MNFHPIFRLLLTGSSRFATLALQVVLASNIIPSHVEYLTIQTINSIYDQFGTDLDLTKSSFDQEATARKTRWTRSKERTSTIAKTLHHPSSCIQIFPNVIKVLQLFLLTSISGASVEQSNLLL